MGKYFTRRLATSIPILLGISVVLFAILHLAPGDPLSIYAANPNITPETKAQIAHHYGLDQPLPVQYLRWLRGLVVGDWGQSFFENRPVTHVVFDRLPVTVKVMGTAFVLSLLLAFPIGVVSAIKQYSLLDHVLTTGSFVGLSVPPFFSGLILIIVFGVKLQWLPFVYSSRLTGTGPDRLLLEAKQLVLPLTVLALYQVGVMTRYIRSAMLEVLHLDYVRTGRAKGLLERTVLLRHALRNAMLPVITLIALSIPGILTGAIITEQIFSIPGIGRLLINSILNSDYLVVMAIVFLYAVLTVLCNLLADVAYALLDPPDYLPVKAASGTGSAVLTPARDERLHARATAQSRSLWFLAWRQFRRHRPALVGLAIVFLMVIAVIAGPAFWGKSTERIDFRAMGQGPSLTHPFGTDDLGRDILARVLAGGRVSLSVGILATAVSIGVGALIGAVAGYAGGWVDGGLMRLTDLFLAIPALPVLILCTSLFAGKGTFWQRYMVVVLVIGALNWMVAGRLVRASFLSLKQVEFVTAARSIGTRPAAIVFKHILPNALGALIVTATLSIGATVIIESSLSFLGLGFQPPQATWGRMLFEAQSTLTQHPHEAIFPGLAIIAFVLAINALGDGLRDALDPYHRG